MKSRPAVFVGVCVLLAALVSSLPALVEWMSPQAGLTRSFYALPAFGGPSVDAHTTEINLGFLDEQTDLPRQQISARWRGFFVISRPQTVEFFAGGNDEVELRVDGELLVRRNLREGMRTIGRRISLDAGAHELSVDFQQFGGSLALNIQRALEGEAPSPFQPAELFVDRLEMWQVRSLAAARWLHRRIAFVWAGLAAGLALTFGAQMFRAWRTAGVPRSLGDYAARVSLFVAPALVAPLVVFVLGPHTIVANNADEFAVPFHEMAAAGLLTVAWKNWLVLCGIGCLVAILSEGLTRMYAALLFALGLMLWGQGNLWNADYGVLTGREVDLAEMAWRAPYENAAFAVALAATALFFRSASRITTFASLAFVGVQAAAVVAADSRPAPNAGWIEPPAGIFQFSATGNVIHIVLDEFQSDLFTDILQQDRAALDRQFSGFEYFEDHAGVFPTTSLSMPAMLTGHEYRNLKPAPEFVRDVFKRESVFERVNRAGWDVDAMSIVPVASFEDWLGPEASPNWSGARFRIRKPFLNRDDYRAVSARQLAELSVFRHAPHSLKAILTDAPARFHRALWMEREESAAEIRRHEASNSAAFLEQFIARMTVGRERPVYKLIHVGIPHRPIVVDRECRYLGVIPITRQTYADQSRCALKLVAALLDRARALGIYDSSVIVVSSDHGTDLAPWGFNGASETLSLVRGPAIPRLGVIAGTAKALMLIKPPRRSGPISVSGAPTSHVDFPSTVLDLLGLADAADGASMFRSEPNRRRRRSFGMYDFRLRFPKEYLDRIHLLSIDGRVVDAQGWNVDRTLWPPSKVLPAGVVDFLSADSHWYLGPGWSMDRQETPEGAGRVTFVQAMTKRPVLFVPSTARQVVLRARASERGSMQIDVDGHRMGAVTIEAGGYRDYSIDLTNAQSKAPIASVTLGFDAMADGGEGFRLDRLVIQ